MTELDTSIAALIGTRSFDEAASSIAGHWQEYLSERPDDLQDRIMALPDDAWESSAVLLLALGCSMRVNPSVSVFAAFPYLDAADDALATDATAPPHLGVQLLLARSAAERDLGRLTDAYEHAIAARELLGSVAVPLSRRIELLTSTLLEVGICLAFMGDLVGASVNLRHGLALTENRPVTGLTVEAIGCLALVDYLSGSATSPRAHVARAVAAAGSTTLLSRGSGAPVLLAQCMVAIDEGDFATAEEVLGQLLPCAAGTVYAPFAMYAEAVIRGERVSPLVQLEAFHEIQLVLHDWQSPSIVHFMHDAGRTNALVQVGAISAAREAIASLHAVASDPHHALCPTRLSARLALHTGDFEGVLALTAGCLALGDNHAPRSLALIESLRAAAHDALGDTGTAAVGVDRALFTAARTGWRMHLTALPYDRLTGMLDAARLREPAPDVLAVIDELSATLSADISEPIRPLSTRERLILEHIVAGETRSQISAHLRVSQNTIKTQVRSIYRKLGAANRHEAIDRAVEYGITA